MPSERDQEIKNRDDFHSQNYPDKEAVSPKALREAELLAKQDKEEVRVTPNFPVNYLTDEEFTSELEFLPFTPQGESVILIGPKLKIPESVKKNSIKLSEGEKNALINKELEKLMPGARVIAISPNAASQMADVIRKAKPSISDEDLIVVAENHFYGLGDYVFTSDKTPVRDLSQMYQPLDPNLSYYRVYHREIESFMTQEQVDRFKPQPKEDGSTDQSN